MSSTASYPKAAGPAGQTAGRAAGRVGALVAPGAPLNPASEAECRGARPKGDQRRPLGRRRVRRGAGGDQGTCRKAGPAWRMSRGGQPRRGRVAGAPLGLGTRNPGSLARMGACGLASESRAGRCLANSMHATGVEARPPASVRPPPRGLSGSRMQPGSPGAGLPYLSTCGLVLYGQGGARESRAWSHVCQAEPSARNLTGLRSESRP